MRALLVLVGLAALVVLAGMALGFIKLDQTQTASLPHLEGGQAPKFEATVAKVNVGTENKVVEVPKVEVQKPGEAPQQ